MDKAYFRSYIRRYACSPQEIRTALKISTNSPEYHEIEDLLEDSIEEEIKNISTNSINSNDGDMGDMVFIAKSCPPENASYCLNGGTCYAEYHTRNLLDIFCKCAPGWEGKRCQRMFNPRIYESAQVAPDIESVSVGPLIAVFLVGLVIFLVLFISLKLIFNAEPRADCVKCVAFQPINQTTCIY